MKRMLEISRNMVNGIQDIIRETNHYSLMYWALVAGFKSVDGEFQSILSSPEAYDKYGL